jgi:23S rRNA pseudouridine1911/1915/1917 synthase
MRSGLLSIPPEEYGNSVIIAINNTEKVALVPNDWIIRETGGWLAVNKPPGLSVERQPGATDTMEDLVLAYLSSKSRKPFVGIVHRLDRPTSGLVLFAKKKVVLLEMNALFRGAKIRKTYLAVSVGTPNLKKGVLENWMIKDVKLKKALIVAKEYPGAALARLQYRILATHHGQALWEIRLLTGKYRLPCRRGYPLRRARPAGSTDDCPACLPAGFPRSGQRYYRPTGSSTAQNGAMEQLGYCTRPINGHALSHTALSQWRYALPFSMRFQYINGKPYFLSSHIG